MLFYWKELGVPIDKIAPHYYESLKIMEGDKGKFYVYAVCIIANSSLVHM